jgi:hypothetical protein
MDLSSSSSNERAWTRFFFCLKRISSLRSFFSISKAKFFWGMSFTSARKSSSKIATLGFLNPAAAKTSMTRSDTMALDIICFIAVSMFWASISALVSVFLAMSALTAWKKPTSSRISRHLHAAKQARKLLVRRWFL